MRTIMDRCRPALLSAALLGLSIAPRATAQDKQDTQQSVPGYRLRLLGVYDEMSGDPIDGVKVADVLSGTSTVTGKTGAVSLFFLPEGTSVVRLLKLGYEAQTMTVDISPTETTPLTIVMHRVVQLAKVVTTDSAPNSVPVSLRGFEERARARRTGYFITDSILRKNEDRNLSDVLRSHASGVGLVVKQGVTYLVPGPRCRDGTKAGPPQVYVDGTPLTAINNQAPFDLTPYQVSDLAGIEWYPDASMIPPEYAHPASRCGALFLWTRQ